MTVPPNLNSGSGTVPPPPIPALTLICGQNFETVSFSGIVIVQIMCPEFNGTDATVTAYKDDMEISLPIQFGGTNPAPDDSVFGTYTFVAENECGRDIATSRILRQGQCLHEQ